MSTSRGKSHNRSFNQSQTCPIPVGNSICGETNSLEIMKEFNKLYEDRMQQVDSIAGGDCLQEKIKLQQDWIQNLTQQNEMLVKAVQDLEYEATERVKQLETKLHKNAQCLCEVMKKYREFDFSVDLLDIPKQRIAQLENDQKNILEFINRIREKEDWSTEGLFFYNITPSDLLGPDNKIINKNVAVNSSEGEELLKTKDRTLEELTEKLNYINSFGDVECMIKELQCRREECKSLKESMADMRQVLTEEVASKHDQIILLKREIQAIEVTCAQAEKQIIFKDDIIKELRKDIKQLKQQFTQDEISKLTATIEQLQTNLKKTKIAQDEEEQAHHKEISKLNEIINGLERDLKEFKQKSPSDQDVKVCKICKGKSKVGFLEHTQVQANLGPKESDLLKELNESKLKMTEEIERRDGEIEHLKCKVNELELALNSCEERANNLQEAVSFYSNSLNILESAEKQDNLQIQQQKITISNLQQALVESKQELDRMQKKWQDNVSGKSWTAWLGLSSSDVVNYDNTSKTNSANNKPVHDI